MMRKILLLVVALGCSLSMANAQIEKGKVLLGASVGFNHIKVDEDARSKAVFLAPKFGYFLSDHFLIGSSIGYGASKSINTGFNTYGGLAESFSVSPFGRYYANITDRFKFLGQLEAGAGFGVTKSVDTEGKVGAKISDYHFFDCALSPGFNYLLTSKVSLEFMFRGVSLTRTKFNSEDGSSGGTSTEFSAGQDSYSPAIGVQFYF